MTFVERCLYEYKANKAAIEAISMEINELMSVRGYSYEGFSPNLNDISDTVFEVTSHKIQLEHKISKLERLTKPVEKLQADPCGTDFRFQQMRDILRLKYIANNRNDDVIAEMCISVPTYWRRVRELLRVAGKYFGERS